MYLLKSDFEMVWNIISCLYLSRVLSTSSTTTFPTHWGRFDDENERIILIFYVNL